jgi:hypothetical protein
MFLVRERKPWSTPLYQLEQAASSSSETKPSKRLPLIGAR